MRPAALLLAVTALALPGAAAAQGVVVDEGRFEITLEGRAAGTEEFTIRRAGIGREDALFANGTVQLRLEAGGQQVIRPLLRASPLDGVAVGYQVEVEGVGAMTLRLSSVGRRYVAVIASEQGEEQREFSARAGTRIVEVDVAHLYYFLGDTREGDVTPVIEPRARAQIDLRTGPAVDEQLTIGGIVQDARRVDFIAGEEQRSVWFDRLGRVLRVRIPARGYDAVRADGIR